MKQDASKIISDIQTVLLYIFVAVLPISILPLPWDFSEKGMSLVILTFSILIIGLEIVKTVWSGKFLLIKKSIDILFFCLIIGLVITTVLAKDENLSLWGYDFRLGGGLIVILASFCTAFISRSFINSKNALIKILEAFLLGSILTSVLSLLSLLGLNFLSIIPFFGDILPKGFPISGSPVVMVIINGLSILLSVVLISLYKGNKQNTKMWYPIIVIIINLVSLTIYSVDVIAFRVLLLLGILWITVHVLKVVKEGKFNIITFLKDISLPILIILLSSLMQIDAVSKMIVSENLLLSPLRLTTDFTWQIVSQSVMSSLKSAIFGIGLDSFSNVFNILKPSELSGFDILVGSNEVLTNMSSAGLLWLVIWIMIGWFAFRELITDINNGEKNSIIIFDTATVFLFLASFITPFTALVRFFFFLVFTLNIIFKYVSNQDSVDSVVLKIWAMETSKESNKGGNIKVFGIMLTAIIGLISILLIISLSRIAISSLYLIRAESYIVSENKKIEGREPTSQERENFVEQMYRYYSKAYEFDSGNTVTNRKLSLMALERLSVIFNRYEENNDDQTLSLAVRLRGEAFDYSRFAINTSPTVYQNWNNRVIVYLGLINLGYSDYIRDAIAVIDQAILLKPLDYTNYYYKAQLYTILEDYEMALDASTQALSINGAYVPALLLSGQINGMLGNFEVQRSYLEAARTVLEANGLQETEVYKRIVEQLNLSPEEVLEIDASEVQEEPL